MKHREIGGFAAGAIIFGFMAYYLLHYSSYLYKFASLSFFQETRDYLCELACRPGFMVIYTGRFLTQFCQYPVIGTVLLIALLAAIALLISKVLEKGSVSLLPPALMFLFTTSLGYDIYTVRSDALVFTQPIGLLCSLLIISFLQTFHKHGLLVPIIAALVFFPLTGFWALLALVCYAIRCKNLWRATASILSAGLVPLLFYLVCYSHTPLEYIYLEGTPYMDFAGHILPQCLLGGSIMLLALESIPVSINDGWWHYPVAGAVAGAVVTSIYIVPDRSLLLHRQLQAEREMERGNWDKVLSLTASLNTTSDPLVSYRNCALYAKGELEKDCYIYSFRTVPLISGKNTYNSSRIAGPAIYYYSGLLNFSARWCSELNLYGSYSLERMKFLAKIALFNKEKALASKYIDAIGRTTLNKGWAKRYKAMLERAELFASDNEYRLLSPLQQRTADKWYPSDVASYNVLMFYSFVTGETRQIKQWNLAAAMLTKSADLFAEVYPSYCELTPEVSEQLRQTAEFFNTLVYSAKDPDNKRNYKNFFFNETILRPN